MSVESLTTGSTVLKQTESAAIGNTWANVPGFSAGTSLECNAQVMSASEARNYDATGQKRFWQVFFGTDPALEKNNRLKLTVWMGTTLTLPKFLRVEATDTEGRPEEPLLWIAYCEEETTRRES